MDVWVKGVKINLTPAQVAVVEKELRAREGCRKSFEKMLLQFGFKKYPGVKGGFEHPYYNWWAEINTHHRYSDVWIVGEGLKTSPFPGGWVYGAPEDVEEALAEALDKLQNEKS